MDNPAGEKHSASGIGYGVGRRKPKRRFWITTYFVPGIILNWIRPPPGVRL